MISALMITGKTPQHYKLALQSVRCFLEQDFEGAKELVIINTNPEAVASRFEWFMGLEIREILLPQKELTLGDLRNISMEEAHGDLLIQWDDDDWHAPNRISWQLANYKAGKINILRQQYRLNLLTGRYGIADGRKCNSQFHGIIGTMFHAPTEARYPSLGKAEDKEFLAKLPFHVQDNPPELYVRLYHGRNTWEEGHIMKPALKAGGGDRKFMERIANLYREEE
jgi:glycosyltransferase involved in cell wall biosynthesis